MGLESSQSLLNDEIKIYVLNEGTRSDNKINIKVIRQYSLLQGLLGGISTSFGVFIIINGIYSISFEPFGSGIWSGIFTLLAGNFGLLTSRKPFDRRLRGTTFVINIIADLIALADAALSVNFARILISYSRSWPDTNNDIYISNQYHSYAVLFSFLAAVSVIESSVAFATLVILVRIPNAKVYIREL